MRTQDKHFLTIKQIYPDVISVVKPLTLGLVHDVYIAECENSKHVCRFSKEIVAKHNLQISNILKEYNINAPRITIHDCGEYYCETYPFIPGKTMHERLLEGLTGDKLDNVYKQIFDISYKMENIPYNNISKTPIPFVSKCIRSIISVLNPSKQKLCHSDLHAKNIILDENDNVSAILDLDAISLEQISVAHFIIMKDAQTYGYDVNKFNGLSKEINVNHLLFQIKLLSTVAKIYKRVLSESARKQLLKIRVK